MISISANIRNARVIPENDAAFRRALAQYEGRRVTLTIKSERKASSTPQRRYWFGVIIATLAEHFGMTKDECHEAVMWHFTRYTDERGLERRKSYNDLTTADAEKLHEEVRAWAAVDHQIYVAMPNEIDVSEYELN